MMNNESQQSIAVRAIKHAIPYIRLYKGATFVIKAGGAVFNSDASAREFVEQVATIHQLGINTVVVHGGGPQSDELSTALGIVPEYVAGRRVTDSRSLELSAMVLNGSVNTQLLALCRDLGVRAIGMSGIDAGLVRATRRPPVEVGNGADTATVDYGHVGDIVSVDTSALSQLLQDGIVPV
ncbi:MAG: acetylglutamate kinase, partial [Planctomycetota bacterium]|nr:acetylglutamate kinase [Planctomycetota bacterium]